MKIGQIPKIIVLVLITQCISAQLLAQDIEQQKDSILNLIEITQADSTKAKRFLDLNRLYLYYNPKQSIQYAEKALKYSQKGNYQKGVFHAYGALFNGHHIQGSTSDSLLKYVQLYEKEALQNGKESDMMGVYFNYAMYYGNIGKTDKELEAYLKSLKLVQKYLPKSNREAALLNNIGIIYYSKGQYDETLKYYKQALSLATDNTSKANILANCGSIYIEDLEKIDSAQTSLDEAMRLYKTENELSGIAFVLIYQAKIQDLKNNYELAYQTYSEAFQIINENDLGYLLPAIHQVITKHFYLQKKYPDVIYYGEKTLDIAIKQQESVKDISEIHDMLHQSYAAIGNYKRAYEVQADLMTLNDSINNINLQSKVEALQTEFEVDQKEAENNLLKVNLQSRKRTSIILIIALLFAIAWGISVFRSSQQRKKYNQILEREVTKRTKELEQANYELRTFNYIASHDIKEPIRVIGGYASLIFKRLPSDLKENLGEYFNTIKRSTAQLYTLVEDFAYYSTLAKGEIIKTEPVDLNLLTYNVIDNLQESIIKYNGEVLMNDLPTINSSNALLFTALKNLIENGLKYNKSEKPTVIINYHKTTTHHQIIISDNGIGIDKEYHEKIFEMFKRLHNRGAYEGSGIGLAIVKLVTEKLGGTVIIESKEGNGSRFTINLPIE